MEEVVAESLLSNKKTIALAESCTGGLVTSRLTDVRGASAYLIGSVVC
ncbi:MAG: CinA family protein, partial [Selenomonadales bacterium]|nr:CinA family protein [Selenomonadales bacterium]